jgi:hypothetical protein
MKIYKGDYNLYEKYNRITYKNTIIYIRDNIPTYKVIILGTSIRYINDRVYGIQLNLSSKYSRK